MTPFATRLDEVLALIGQKFHPEAAELIALYPHHIPERPEPSDPQLSLLDVKEPDGR